MKVLGIMGSARPDGNTNDLLDVALAAAAAAGAQVEKIMLTDHRVEHIENCRTCVERGRCVHEADDFTSLMAKVYAVDAILFASPVYWYSIAGRLKVFLDRWSCEYYRDSYEAFAAKLRPKAMGVITVQEETGVEQARHLIGALEKTVGFARATYLGYVLGPGGKRGSAKANPEAVAAAHDLGRRAAAHVPAAN